MRQPSRKEHLMYKQSLIKGIEGRRRRGRQKMKWLDNITNSMDMNLSKPQEIVEDRGPWLQSTRPQRVRHSLVTEQQQLL